ncbi:hypothetical protein S245_069952, partial [Arachis hypogaea]
DGHIRIMEWPSMNNILDEPRAHKSVRDMDFSGGKRHSRSCNSGCLSAGLCGCWTPKNCCFSVECEKARRYIPREFKLAEAFGGCNNYYLIQKHFGCFFLASYEDSPAGVFDEVR